MAPLSLRTSIKVKLIWAIFIAYILFACARLDFTWDRFVLGLHQGATFIGRLFPPHVLQPDSMLKGLQESVEIAILASFLGVIFSLPLGILAARNLMPAWVTWIARGIIALCRSFHPLIIAIIFVKAIGFGALAGILTLVVASMGFIGKLFAEAIEEISIKQVEAVRATGAPFFSVLDYGVFPQVMARFVGFVTYQIDSNLRNSTMVGIVGAGGIGGTLFAAYQRFDYDFVCAILLAIIAMIICGELIAKWVRILLIGRKTSTEMA